MQSRQVLSNITQFFARNAMPQPVVVTFGHTVTSATKFGNAFALPGERHHRVSRTVTEEHIKCSRNTARIKKWEVARKRNDTGKRQVARHSGVNRKRAPLGKTSQDNAFYGNTALHNIVNSFKDTTNGLIHCFRHLNSREPTDIVIPRRWITKHINNLARSLICFREKITDAIGDTHFSKYISNGSTITSIGTKTVIPDHNEVRFFFRSASFEYTDRPDCGCHNKSS